MGAIAHAGELQLSVLGGFKTHIINESSWISLFLVLCTCYQTSNGIASIFADVFRDRKLVMHNNKSDWMLHN